ncbi:TPA: hypothetical protein DIC39_03035 [Patescibacteria group bacterium]|nr:MAG: hypothetical protein A2006_11660 [Ignavibacteria bacterium GWC2_35_8]OGW71168.1 MAG: hypothetical protein A2047_03945 [Omnitrophica bacterium GWA2_41_15]HCU48006.1 hypothetical protein [Patescibacteria group bacterium]
MNVHLNPVFEVILPAIEKEKISYWVYGGVAIAAIKGNFIRENTDVDIFVYDEDYIKVINLVEIIGGNLGWTYKDRQPLKGVRHKREFFPDHEKHDIFSVIPVYKFNGKIKFVYDKDIILENILTQEKRTIENHSFFTPSAAFLRELFICSWEGKKLSKERQQDAKIILAQYQHG